MKTKVKRPNIAKGKEVDEALKAEKNKLQSLIDALDCGLNIQDKDHNIIYQNEFVRKIYGDRLGEKCYRVYEGKKRVCDGCPIEKAFRDGKSHTTERRIVLPSGEVTFWENTANPIRDARGRIVSCLEVTRNITERKQAEEALKAEKNKLQSLIDAMEDYLTIRDKEYKIIYQSERVKKLWGDHLGEKCYRAFEGRNKICDGCPAEKAFKDGKSHTTERKSVIPSGGVVFWENTASPVRDAEGRIVACLEIGKDITERKKREQLQHDENYVLTLLGEGTELNELLDAILRLVEYHDPSIKGSVLLFDPAKNLLRPASAPSLPATYKELLKDGVPIGPIAGACGTATYRKERVIIPDIKNSPLFKPYKEVVRRATQNGLLACWSQPIISSKGDVLGTIANYSNKVGEPSAENIKVLEWSARIAAIATERKQTEEALRKSEEKFSKAFRASPSTVTITTLKDGKFLELNDTFTRLTGYSREELIGRNSTDINFWVNPEDRKRILQIIKGQGRVNNEEFNIRIKSGEIRTWLFSMEPIDIGGELCILSATTDITESKRAEEELRGSEERFRSIVENSQAGIMILDDAYRLVYVNDELCRLSGYSREESIGQDFRKFLDDESKQLVAERYIRRQRGEEVPVRYEFNIVRKDGQKRRVETSSAVIKDSAGKTKTLAQIMDITERKRAEEALKESQEFSSSLLENSPNPIAVMDLDTSMRYVNPAFEKLTGFTSAEITGKKVPYPFWPEEQREELTARLKKTIARGSGGRSERMFQRKNGEHFWVEMTSALVKHKGKPAYFLLNWLDITKRKQAEELYHTLASSSPVGVYIVQDGKFVFVNPQFKKYSGFSEEELLGAAPLKLVHPEDRERVRERAVAMLKGKRLAPYELRYITKDGEALWATETVTSIHYKGKRATLGNFMDITERRQAEEMLRQSKEKLQQMFESVTDGIVVVDLNGIIIEVNQRTVEIHGYKSKGELFGKSALKLVAPRDHEQMDKNMKQAVKEGRIGNIEYTLLKADGTEFPAELSTSVLRDASGKAIAHITIVRDVTKRKQMEEALKESQEFSSSLLESSPNPINVVNLDTSIRYVNPAFEKLTGFALAEIAGKKAPHPWWPEEQREEILAAFKKHVTTGGRRTERIFQKKNGERFWVALNSAQVMQDRKPIYLIMNWLDITERKQMEQKLKQHMEELQLAYQQLKDLDKLKDSFLSTVSHELRTPLTSIKSFSEILLNYDEDKETQREFLNIINEESNRLTRLINDFLDLAKIEAGRMQWENAELSLAEVIQTALNATQALAIKTNLKVDTSFAPDLPIIQGDKDRLVQVVTNLLSNAIKFTPEGGRVQVKAQLLNGSKPGKDHNMVMVSVTDSGIGIAPKDHESIFEKFKQVGDTLSGKPKGTGLGLPICKEIVEHYGGRLWVESELGKGSTFSFTIPVTPKAEAEAPVTKEETKKEEAKITAKKGKTILVVDDEANIRRFLSHELTTRGYQVLEASGGKAAIDLTRKNHPDLITLDVMMPDINGHDVVAVLKNDPDTKDIPILVLSIVEEKEKAYRLGVNDFVTKPFTMKVLMEKISRLLNDAQKTIMVIDDDKPLVRSLKYRLEKKGFSIYTAFGGKEALETIVSHPPDLVLLDIVMPEMDGYEVMKALKYKPDTAQIPIVVMTGVENVGGKVKALSVGATEYLKKSSGFDELLKTIESILYGKSGGDFTSSA
jgi:PAS domain S-box-containing protein